MPNFSLPLNSDLLLDAPIGRTQPEARVQKGQLMQSMEVRVLGYSRAKNAEGVGPGRQLAGNNHHIASSLFIHLELFVFLNKST